MESEGTIHHDRILIVDDQVANIRLLEGILRRAGYTSVTSTTDSREALAIGVLVASVQCEHEE